MIGRLEPHILPVGIKAETVDQDGAENKDEPVEAEICGDRVENGCLSRRDKSTNHNEPKAQLQSE